MASEVNLTKAVRSNLSSLQNVAQMMATTQDRLSTGNKVNSALDNPTNFFTAASLNSRAGDLNSLMDSMANGIKTLEAADNGLTAITKNLDSMTSTLRQARQDMNFQTASYDIDASATGKLSFTGGAVGDTAVGVDLQKATFVGNGGFAGVGETAQAGGTLSFVAGSKVNNGLAVTVDYSLGDTAATTAQKINDKMAKTYGGDAVRATVKNGQIELSNTNNQLFTAVTGGQAIGLLSTTGAVQAVVVGTLAGTATAPATFAGGDIVVDGKTISLAAFTGADATATGAQVAQQLNDAFADKGMLGFTASSATGTLTISNLSGKNFSASGAAATALSIPATASTNGKTALGAVNGVTSSSVAKTTDELVETINNTTALQEKVRASNDNGRLRVENLSTQQLNVTGASGGTITGLTNAKATVLGNQSRADFADQFNELRDQLDKLSDDASFNGVNLLRGDNLKITFNETGTSAIEIQTKDGDAINSTNLDVETTLTAKDLDSGEKIDAYIDQIKDALNDVRSQSSAFGSNLSIVQNRQDFTKSMIDTLQTGAGNLTLADMNEEAANMMALQTRQSLAQSTLSMANQADQGVLQMLR